MKNSSLYKENKAPLTKGEKNISPTEAAKESNRPVFTLGALTFRPTTGARGRQTPLTTAGVTERERTQVQGSSLKRLMQPSCGKKNYSVCCDEIFSNGIPLAPLKLVLGLLLAVQWQLPLQMALGELWLDPILSLLY